MIVQMQRISLRISEEGELSYDYYILKSIRNCRVGEIVNKKGLEY